MIRFACPTCKTVLSAAPEQGGSKVNCPRCGQRLLVPQDHLYTVLEHGHDEVHAQVVGILRGVLFAREQQTKKKTLVVPGTRVTRGTTPLDVPADGGYKKSPVPCRDESFLAVPPHLSVPARHIHFEQDNGCQPVQN